MTFRYPAAAVDTDTHPASMSARQSCLCRPWPTQSGTSRFLGRVPAGLPFPAAESHAVRYHDCSPFLHAAVFHSGSDALLFEGGRFAAAAAVPPAAGIWPPFVLIAPLYSGFHPAFPCGQYSIILRSSIHYPRYGKIPKCLIFNRLFLNLSEENRIPFPVCALYHVSGSVFPGPDP